MKSLANIWTTILTGDAAPEKRTAGSFLSLFFILLSILIVIRVFNILTIIGMDTLGGIPSAESSETALDKMSKWKSYLLAAVLAPLIEEMTFRLGLRFSKWNFIITCTGLFYLISRVIFDVELASLIWILPVFIALCFLALNDPLTRWLADLWSANKRVIFYFLLLAFVSFHLSNYEMSLGSIPSLALQMLPHFFGGIIFSYARLKWGIFLSILLHVMNNAIFLLPDLIMN